MNILQFFQDYKIQYQTEGHKHCRPGWINTSCPFCSGNTGLHLGATLNGSHFYCWRCGWHPTQEVISKLLNIHKEKAKQIVREYNMLVEASAQPAIKIRTKAHKLPSGICPLLPQHTNYLKQRKFDPTYLEKQWGLLGTGPISLLDEINYRHRIIAPIIWEGKQVTFQARDITEKHTLKYMACPKDRELIHHKHILYGKQEKWGATGICVEGITDVWRFGESSFCTFGIEFTLYQIRIMAKQFKRIAVIFDDDPQAKRQAAKLIAELGFRGVDAFKIEIQGDPGDMSEDDAQHLVKSIQ